MADLENETDKTISESPIDKNYVYSLKKNFIRIEYPGLVKNVGKAVDTLGGIYNIETALMDPKRKLELKFHYENKYNKPCVSDRNSNPGLLIKVKKNVEECDYDIIGFVSDSFTFNKAADFQYLPLIQDDKIGNVEYVYDSIMPKNLPNLEYLMSNKNINLSTLLLPSNFSRHETSHHTLYLKASEKFSLETNARPELFKIFEKKPKDKFQYRQISHMVNISDPNLEIPHQPKYLAMKLVREKCMEDNYLKIKTLFDQRPMWIKAALQHQSGITAEMSKVLLPANGYFWVTGPWRMVWTKFGYDPRKNFTSRIYQTLDFRIRESEGTKIIIRAKRTQGLVRRDGRERKIENDESHYILSPDLIPPARQMFYQFCDIRIPEIQEMVQRLPKVPGTQRFDIKNGWLPSNFSDQCREIANKYVMELVHRELVASSESSSQVQQLKMETDDQQKNPLSYSSEMLNRLKKGFRRNIDTLRNAEDIETVLSDDEDSDDDMEQEIPSILDEEPLSDNSEMELDMEAVDEINLIISDIKKET